MACSEAKLISFRFFIAICSSAAILVGSLSQSLVQELATGQRITSLAGYIDTLIHCGCSNHGLRMIVNRGGSRILHVDVPKGIVEVERS